MGTKVKPKIDSYTWQQYNLNQLSMAEASEAANDDFTNPDKALLKMGGDGTGSTNLNLSSEDIMSKLSLLKELLSMVMPMNLNSKAKTNETNNKTHKISVQTQEQLETFLKNISSANLGELGNIIDTAGDTINNLMQIVTEIEGTINRAGQEIDENKDVIEENITEIENDKNQLEQMGEEDIPETDFSALTSGSQNQGQSGGSAGNTNPMNAAATAFNFVTGLGSGGGAKDLISSFIPSGNQNSSGISSFLSGLIPGIGYSFTSNNNTSNSSGNGSNNQTSNNQTSNNQTVNNGKGKNPKSGKARNNADAQALKEDIKRRTGVVNNLVPKINESKTEINAGIAELDNANTQNDQTSQILTTAQGQIATQVQKQQAEYAQLKQQETQTGTDSATGMATSTGTLTESTVEVTIGETEVTVGGVASATVVGASIGAEAVADGTKKLGDGTPAVAQSVPTIAGETTNTTNSAKNMLLSEMDEQQLAAYGTEIEAKATTHLASSAALKGTIEVTRGYGSYLMGYADFSDIVGQGSANGGRGKAA